MICPIPYVPDNQVLVLEGLDNFIQEQSRFSSLRSTFHVGCTNNGCRTTQTKEHHDKCLVAENNTQQCRVRGSLLSGLEARCADFGMVRGL